MLSATEQATHAIRIEDSIEPGIELFDRCSLDTLCCPVRQGAKAKDEQA